jgi:hypothetical protein
LVDLFRPLACCLQDICIFVFLLPKINGTS